MEITVFATKEVVTTRCTGCQCHEMSMTFGLSNGCCVECGCPKNMEGVEYYRKTKPDHIKPLEPTTKA